MLNRVSFPIFLSKYYIDLISDNYKAAVDGLDDLI